MARFLAKEFNMAGKTNWEQAKGDMLVDCCTDLLNKGLSEKMLTFLILIFVCCQDSFLSPSPMERMPRPRPWRSS